MAPAGMVGISRVAGRDRGSGRAEGVDWSVLTQPGEADLIKELADFPAMVAGAAAAREPHRITGYLEGLARLAHAWNHKRSEEHTSELQSQSNLVCRLLLEKKKTRRPPHISISSHHAVV